MVDIAKNFQENKRILWVDWLKVVAIISVLFVHLSSQYLCDSNLFKAPWYQGLFFESLGRAGIVLFIMASGYLILQKKQQIMVIPRRLKRIFIPFTFWLVVYGIVKVLVKGELGSNWNIINLLQFIFNGFLDPTIVSVQFWFVYMIMGLYLFSPILSNWIHNSNISEIEYFLGIWIIISIINLFNLNLLILDYLMFFTGVIGYFILGYYLTIKQSKYLYNRKFGLLLFILGTLLCFFGTLVTSYFSGNQSFLFIQLCDLTPNALLQGVGLFIIIKNTDFKNLFGKYNSLINNIAIKISLTSYGIYLSNILFIKFLEKVGIFTNNGLLLIKIPFYLIVTLIISGLFILLMNKLPVLNYFSGIKRN